MGKWIDLLYASMLPIALSILKKISLKISVFVIRVKASFNFLSGDDGIGHYQKIPAV